MSHEPVARGIENGGKQLHLSNFGRPGRSESTESPIQHKSRYENQISFAPARWLLIM